MVQHVRSGLPIGYIGGRDASPLKGLDASGDPAVRFAPDGDLLVAGIAFNRDFDQPDRPVDNLIYVARYNYTPGSPGGVSTPNSAANPPNFTYAGTTVVDRGRWLREAWLGRLRGDVHRQGVDGGRPELCVRQRLRRGCVCLSHGLPRRRELANHVQRLRGRRSDVLAPRRFHRRAVRHAAEPGSDLAVGPDGASTSPTPRSRAAAIR